MARIYWVLALLAILSSRPALARWPTPALGESPDDQPSVLFTFDDGPHERFTPRVLDALAEYQVQAVFYWVGRRIRGDKPETDLRRALAFRALAEGHLIGNHTVNHVHLCSVSSEVGAAEIDTNASLYTDLVGLPLLLFRAPYGDHCRKLETLLAERNLGHMHWDIDPQEFLGRSTDSTAKYVTNKLKKLTGPAIVLMHDTQGATARALPKILQWIADENTRRADGSRPPIRILRPSEMIAEQYSIPLLAWAHSAVDSGSEELALAFKSLIPGATTGSATGPAAHL